MGYDDAIYSAWEKHCRAVEEDVDALRERQGVEALAEEQERDAAVQHAVLSLGDAARGFEAGGFVEMARVIRAVQAVARKRCLT